MRLTKLSYHSILKCTCSFATRLGELCMELFTVGQAAKKVGVTPDHMRRLLNSKKVYGMKFGQEWIIASAELGKFQRSTRGRPKKNPLEGG